MTLGIISGTIVSTRMSTGIDYGRYLLVEKCNPQGSVKGDFVVALDLTGAGRGEMVLISEGSPARETTGTVNKPLDALIVGIVDMIDENDIVLYRK
jgi:microcompartment protein CcmK/EutM